MGRILVNVLKPFGPHRAGGAVKVDESQVDYLLKKQLITVADEKQAKRFEVEQSGKKYEESYFTLISDLSDIVRIEPPSTLEEAEAKTDEILAILRSSSPENSTQSEPKENPNQGKSFEQVLKEQFDASVNTSLNNAALLTPQDILDYSVSDLVSLPNIGNKIAEKLHKVATDYTTN